VLFEHITGIAIIIDTAGTTTITDTTGVTIIIDTAGIIAITDTTGGTIIIIIGTGGIITGISEIVLPRMSD
jgi:hypothetical protein